MKESAIEKKIREYAGAKGCIFRKFVSPGKRGVQDRIVINAVGVVGFMEIKKPNGPVHAKQLRDARRLNRRGVPIIIVDNVESAKTFIDKLCLARITNYFPNPVDY